MENKYTKEQFLRDFEERAGGFLSYDIDNHNYDHDSDTAFIEFGHVDHRFGAVSFSHYFNNLRLYYDESCINPIGLWQEEDGEMYHLNHMGESEYSEAIKGIWDAQEMYDLFGQMSRALIEKECIKLGERLISEYRDKDKKNESNNNKT